MEPNGILHFMLAALTLNVTPGPDMLYVIARIVGQGRAPGTFSSLGIARMPSTHATCRLWTGWSLLATVPVAYEVIKYVGAAYLIFLGYERLRAAGARGLTRR
jgi:threonine/homoserine/homoserine lactone efflux protein